jgi:hypothetical protein
MNFWKSTLPTIALISTIAYFPPSQTAIGQTPEQREAIKAATIAVVRQPGRPTPTVEKITLVGEYGLVSWLMGEAGGMVELIARGGTWEAIALPGGLPSPDDLSQATGIPADVAAQLLSNH